MPWSALIACAEPAMNNNEKHAQSDWTGPLYVGNSERKGAEFPIWVMPGTGVRPMPGISFRLANPEDQSKTDSDHLNIIIIITDRENGQSLITDPVNNYIYLSRSIAPEPSPSLFGVRSSVYRQQGRRHIR